MALFDAGSVAFQSGTVSTTSGTVYNPNSAALGSLSPAVTLRDVSIVNTGTVGIYLATGGTVGTANTTNSFLLPAGAQVTIQGWTATSGSTANQIYGIVASGSGAYEAGLASVASVV